MDAAAKRRRAGQAAQGPLTKLFSQQRTAPEAGAQADKENGDASGLAAKRSRTGGLGENRAAGRTVEEIYQKKSQLEHILLRPDSYVGSTERQTQEQFVFDDQAQRMVRRKLEFVPALYKIFDEILVNAADNLVRCASQDTIRVEVNRAKGYISVWNNGSGLPVQIHKEHGCYVPELVFGQLLTSDNYDDSERKVTGGRNGYGAKLTNIFSHRFIVETADSRSGKWYKQVWEKNMTTRNQPQLKPAQMEDFTQVTFFPDFARFGMTALEDDIVALMRRRAYDVAASTHGRCKVFLDGRQLQVHSFQDYVGLHLATDAFRVYEAVNDRWEIAIGLTDGSGFQQVSFVNSINTSRGGGHVNYVADQVVNAIMEKISKQKGGGLAVKPTHVKGYLWVFVNCLIENPAFDSQTKETLTSKRERFGSSCQLPESLIAAVVESGIVDALLDWSRAMGKSELAQHLNRSDLGLQKRLFGVPKLEDANKAGTKEGADCTLILTEGDSAKALAVAGLGVIGRDYYGVFPLRGKLRNVRELTVKQMLENREIDQLMKIMALDASKEYIDGKGLRYGSIMIMTDQDHDGSHIKGLIINFIQHWFPSLFRVPGFLKEFVTPIVKATKGDESQTFFTLPEYTNWKEENNDGKGWKTKYYKGLGTSTSEEAREYFSDLETHELHFSYGGPADDDLIDMAFHPKRSDDRKSWIGACEEGTFVDHSQSTLSYNDFIKKELVLFAKYDVERAVPSMVDGFKPGQRKVLFGTFKKKLSADMKVAQLSGYVAEHSAYHHGETSLQGTIVGLAQNFVGSNNINLLIPSGQFGTRLKGGKDHAAARYIFTRMSRTARRLMPEEDDPVLEHLSEEGMSIEPRWYCPVIPLVLVNGADGIGTGWSTSVPNYNPREIIANIRRYLAKQPLEPMQPWYRGFKGTVAPVPNTPGRFECCGVAVKRGRVRLEIMELPVGRWTQDYKEWLLEQLPQPGSEKRSLVTEIREYHSENSVHFTLSMTPDKLAEAERKGIEKVFHLRGSIATTNMWLFDAEGNIKKYETPEHIIEEFAPVRLGVYKKRKDYLMSKMERELAVISNKLKFIRLVVSDRLDVEKRKTADLCKDLRRHGLQTMRDIHEPGSPPLTPEEEPGARGYKYLLSMKLWSLTEDRLNTLAAEHKKKEEALEELRNTSLEELWERDLQQLEQALDACDAEDRKEAEAAAKLAAKAQGNEDILVNKQCVLVLSRNFTAKRVRTSEWKARRRGAKLQGRSLMTKEKKGGKAAEKENEEGEKEGEGEGGEEEEADTDALAGVFCCHDFDALLCFSEHGMAYMLQALDVPLAKKMTAQGSQLTDFLPELGNHRITALVTVPHTSLKGQIGDFVVLVSAHGFAKKVQLDRFRTIRPGKGIQCMKLAQGDELKWALRASENSALVLSSALGMVLRCSLGEDWHTSSIKSPGRCCIKMKSGDDELASCGISDLTPDEIESIARAEAKKRERRDAREALRNGSTVPGGTADGNQDIGATQEAEEETQADKTATVPMAGRRKSKAMCDDDDSDNGGEATQEASTAVGQPEAASKRIEKGDGEESDNGDEAARAAKDSDSEKEEKDDEDEADSDAERPSGDKPAAPGAEGASAAKSGKSEQHGQCVLLVAKSGMGLRMPLACKRIGLRRRGGKGLKCMKLQEGRFEDTIASLGIVSGRTEINQRWRVAWEIFGDEVKANLPLPDASQPPASQPAASSEPAAAAEPPAEAVESPAPTLSTYERFMALPEAEREEYERRAEEEKQQVALAMEEWHKEHCEEVLFGSDRGLVVRVGIESIPIMCRAARGKILCRLKDGDAICTMALLSTMETELEEGATPAAAPAAPRAAPPPARPRPPRRPRAKDAAGSSAAASVPGAASSPRMAGSALQGAAVSDDTRCSHRLRGKTRQSLALCPWLAKRGRLSLLASSPKSRAASAARYAAQQSARLSIVKPQLRLLNKTRKSVVVRSLDLSQWAAKAAAAAAASLAAGSGGAGLGR